MKLRWVKWWPDAWLSDESLRGCSPMARALWVDIICLMAKSKRHGYLLSGDSPMNTTQLARIFGESKEITENLLSELSTAQVFSVADGAIFSRRMVKDENDRKSSRLRVYKFRAKCVTPSVTPLLQNCNGAEDKRIRGSDIKKERAQVRPTLSQWSDYAKSIGWIGKDVQGAFDHYESNGWKVGGRAPVKDWQAAARNCFRRNQTTNQKGNHTMQPKPQPKSSCESAPLYKRMGFASYYDWQKAGFPS